MEKNEKLKKYIPDLFTAVVYFSVGVGIRHYLEDFLKYTYYTITALLIFGAFRMVVNYFTGKKTFPVMEGFVNTALAAVLIFRPFSLYYLIRFACSAYFLLLCVIHMVAFFQQMKDNAGISAGLFLLGLFEIYFAYNLFFTNNNSIVYLGKSLGLHFMLYGGSIMLDIITREFLLWKIPKKRFHISLPNIFCAFIPKRILTYINRFIRNKDITEEMINLKKKDDYQLEIFIHMADTLFGQVGHVDMCYYGHVISYGSYDESSYRLNGMLGDGVVELIDREKYIRFCLEESNKHIVSFGIRLTPEEELRLQKKLTDIYDNLERWNPPIMESEGNIITTVQYELDYASALHKKTNAKFYKFKDGKYSKYKTYFGLFTNCATMAKEITAEIGINLFDFSGILSPGTFYDYLNSEFKRANSFVVSRNLYALEENVK